MVLVEVLWGGLGEMRDCGGMVDSSLGTSIGCSSVVMVGLLVG